MCIGHERRGSSAGEKGVGQGTDRLTTRHQAQGKEKNVGRGLNTRKRGLERRESSKTARKHVDLSTWGVPHTKEAEGML